MSHMPIPSSSRAQSDVTDERCWTKCRQTNARRGLGLEPICTSVCLLNFRNAVGKMVPVPGRPGTFLAEPAPPLPEPILDHPPAPPGVNLPAYHWPWLDGRYFYYARGRENIDRHAQEMAAGDWRSALEAVEDRIDAREDEFNSAHAHEQRNIQRAMGLPDPRLENVEKLVSLSELWSTSFRRLHLHVMRIYSPGLRNLGRLPEIYADGTASGMVEQLKTKATDGSAFKLVDRMWTSLQTVAKELKARRDAARENAQSGGGGLAPPPSPFGGLGPTPRGGA